MKAYIILNIVSIFFLVIAFSCYTIDGSDIYYNHNRFRVYYEEQEAKGKNDDEISKDWEKQQMMLGNIIESALVLSIVISFILSIISVYLKPNFIGIILIVISSICVLIGIYIYIMGKGYRT